MVLLARLWSDFASSNVNLSAAVVSSATVVATCAAFTIMLFGGEADADAIAVDERDWNASGHSGERLRYRGAPYGPCERRERGAEPSSGVRGREEE